MKTMQVKFDRVIPAAPAAVYKAWLDPKVAANPWHGSDRLDWKPRLNGLFYFRRGAANCHYGKFLALQPGKKIQSTWMSQHTCGLESLVTVNFRKKGKGTLVQLRHTNLPDNAEGRLHQEGWDWCLGMLEKVMGPKKR